MSAKLSRKLKPKRLNKNKKLARQQLKRKPTKWKKKNLSTVMMKKRKNQKRSLKKKKSISSRFL